VPEKILFISDVTAELKAAQGAGMQTLFSVRLGNHSSESEGFVAIQNFDSV
jgi:enolase-phosphatase E1